MESSSLIITLQKLVNLKWPALTDTEALEARFGPLKSATPTPTSPRPLKKTSDKDGAAAFSSRQKVDALLRSAQRGDVPSLKAAVLELAENDPEKLQETATETKDATGRTCLHFAANKGHLEAVQYLLEELKVLPDLQDEGGETPLMLAAREGHLEVSRKLLEHGADVSIGAIPGGAGAIHQAAGQGPFPPQNPPKTPQNP